MMRLSVYNSNNLNRLIMSIHIIVVLKGAKIEMFRPPGTYSVVTRYNIKGELTGVSQGNALSPNHSSNYKNNHIHLKKNCINVEKS